MNKYKTSALIEKTPFFDTFISVNKEGKKRLGIRFYRWLSIFCINFSFFLSYNLDFQALEGTLSGSRFFGFHLIDPFISMQMFLAHYNLHINLIIGTVTILAFYFAVGGRVFCSWVCPYNILGEISEKLHKSLVKKKIIKSYELNYKIKYVFWAFFLFLAYFAGYLVFEIINPVGILSRAIVYGWSFAMFIVALLFFIELFFAQRFWCRYVCPLGTTYGFLGWISATKIKWNDKCDHCGVCSKVCLVPHVLDKVKNTDKKEAVIINGDCTLCGRCIEVCHKDALGFDTKLKKLI
ncbi:MAG: NapH/MauN family ferredoxin-type protein [Campylobacteraceae bacterium]|jgi:ferredoxin-type protein NapH|nr:NapH/MauN family ferredoxin-type protein [Campylobacteraceae bacterium]